MGKMPYYCYKSMRSNTDFGGNIMTKWEHANNKRSHSHLSCSYFRSIPISLSNLVPISMEIPWERWKSRISHSHAHLYSAWFPGEF